MYGHTFNLLNRDWMADKLVNREPTPEETQILNHLFALQPHCNTDLYPVHFLPISQKTRNFWDFSGILRIGPLTSNLNSGRRPQSYHIGLTVPQKTRRLTVLHKTQKLFFLFLVFYLHFLFCFLHILI